MHNFPYIHVVVLSYNRCEDTLQALESLSNSDYPNFEIVVVDNASTDQTAEQVLERFSKAVLLIQPTNLGFAAGVNVGLTRAIEKQADFVLVLNNDIQVAPSMLRSLVEAMTPDIGAAAPFIYYFDEPERIWSTGFSKHPLLLEMRGGARGQMDRGQWPSPIEVDYLLGCALLVSVPILKQVGLFDDQYFFFYEDLDLSLRMKEHGFRLVTLPQAKLWHKVAKSASFGSAFRTYHLARSSAIFFKQHTRGFQRLAVLTYRLGSAFVSSWRFLWNRRLDLLGNYWQGLWDGLLTH